MKETNLIIKKREAKDIQSKRSQFDNGVGFDFGELVGEGG